MHCSNTHVATTLCSLHFFIHSWGWLTCQPHTCHVAHNMQKENMQKEHMQSTQKACVASPLLRHVPCSWLPVHLTVAYVVASPWNEHVQHTHTFMQKVRHVWKKPLHKASALLALPMDSWPLCIAMGVAWPNWLSNCEGCLKVDGGTMHTHLAKHARALAN